MPKNLFPLDNTKKFRDQKLVGHNRWHPDIPAAVRVVGQLTSKKRLFQELGELASSAYGLNAATAIAIAADTSRIALNGG